MLKYIKSINEYNNELLYHRIEESELSILLKTKCINVSDNAFNVINDYVRNYMEDFSKRKNIDYKSVKKVRLITDFYFIQIKTDYTYINIHQLPDEYFVVTINFKYYLCDEITGVIEFLKGESWYG